MHRVPTDALIPRALLSTPPILRDRLARAKNRIESTVACHGVRYICKGSSSSKVRKIIKDGEAVM